MSRSFFMVMLIPLLLYVWVSILADFFKYLRYRLTDTGEQIKSNAEQNEPPILVLQFNRPLKIWLAIMTFFPLLLFGFLKADYVARDDMNRLFFSLNKEQTYILYCWAWKFVCGGIFLWFGTGIINTFSNKKVSFFKNIVVIENALTGRRSLVLNNHVRCTKGANGIGYWLYNELSMKHLLIDRTMMKKLDSRQEKLLDEILSKIPEKKKTFYI